MLDVLCRTSLVTATQMIFNQLNGEMAQNWVSGIISWWLQHQYHWALKWFINNYQNFSITTALFIAEPSILAPLYLNDFTLSYISCGNMESVRNEGLKIVAKSDYLIFYRVIFRRQPNTRSSYSGCGCCPHFLRWDNLLWAIKFTFCAVIFHDFVLCIRICEPI